ncbi:MAG: carboxypeptidase-like regulatory domain-containing protein [Prevotella sp.]|nr:carboxypeptidase-like regulatory domain-containing protein [Prevotella sp.]
MFNKHRTFFRQLFAAVFLSLTINVSAQITATDGLVGNTVGVTSDDNADGGYKSLWNEVYNHAKADLPRSQIQVLQHIKEKARAEHNYGQLLTAQLMEATLTVSISPDSLKAVVEQLRKEEQMANDTAIAAVYRTVLSRLLNVRRIEPDTAAMLAQKAVEKPEILAAKSALDWQPFLVRGCDGSIFNDDLLSVVGFATGNAKAVHEYYLGTDNRKAQLVSAYMMLGTERSSTKKITDDIRVLDSLMTCYADLPECGELAIRKLQLMSESSCTPRQQIVFIDEALQKWGDWKNAVALQNARDQLIYPYYKVQFGQECITPADTLTLHLSKVRNPGILTVRVSKLDISQRVTRRNMAYEELQEHVIKRDIMTKRFNPRALQPYETYDTTFVMGMLPVGIYLVEVASDQPDMTPVYEIVHVSRVRLLTLPLPNGKLRMAVVDAITGHPLPYAKIDVIENDKLRNTLSTNSVGETMWTSEVKNRDYSKYNGFEVYTEDDRASASFYRRDYFYGGTGSKESKTELIASCYTDRAIYRPGQNVNLAILVMTNTQNRKFKPYKGEVELAIDDPAYDEVIDTVLITDEFGTAYIQVPIPANGVLGEYDVEVSVDDEDVAFSQFRVEEYKRPTFDVELLPLKTEDIHDGEVLVRGQAKSLSGAPISGAMVAVDVKRTLSAPRWMSEYRDMPVLADTVVTDENGAFQIHMPVELPKVELSLDDSLMAKWYFHVLATVTDRAGETHEGNTTISRTLRPYTLSVTSLPNQVEVGQTLRFKPVLVDRWGLPVNKVVRVWTEQSVDTLQREANQMMELPVTASLGAIGHHRLYVKFDDMVKDYVLKVVDFSANRLGVFSRDFFAQSASLFPQDGGKVNIQFGTSLDSVYVLYTVFSENKVVESGAFELSDAIHNRSFTYKRSYGKGLTLSYVFVKDGEVTTHNTTIYAPLPDKSLKMEWTTFRDRLQPGQQETWTLRVRHADGSPAKAQLLSTLYDASLDPLARHQWEFHPYIHTSLNPQNWRYEQSMLSSSTPSFHQQRTTFPLSLNTFDDRLMRLKGDSTVLQRILSMAKKPSEGWAQGTTGYVSGIVIDEEGDPVIGASVMINGTKKGTVTDINGQFSLPVSGGVTLNVMYVGYSQKAVRAFSGNYIEVRLEPDYMALDEVVVVGYGTQQKKLLTGSVSGIQVQQEVAVPLSVRGSVAEGAFMPLYVIDGVVVDNLSGIDLNTISDLKVIKDASATEIYGSRASNGVIVISTQGAPMEDAAQTLNQLIASLSPQPAVVRENFEETAFFHPRLMADDKGEFVISFTLPESVTSWRFMGLAHDREMNFGLSEALAVAQKEVMVQPNLPRFIRVGDQSVFSARVANLSDKVKKGVAELTLSDINTGEMVWSGNQPFNVAAGTTEGVNFAMPAFETTAALVCRTIVRGDDFNDGEQQVIPVVPARELVTTTYPFVMKGEQKLELTLDRLLPADADQRRLTFEYTAHPEWLAIGALPVLSATTDIDAVSQAAVYYANQLGRMVTEGSPAIRQAVMAWQNDSTLQSPLNSALQKNTSLKEMLLSETPWMTDAEGERAMKRKMATFFDTKTMDKKCKDALDQLKKLQNADGGWAWCQGMSSSVYTSVLVMEMLARIQMLKPTKDCTKLLDKGLAFLQTKAHKEVEEMRKDTVKGHHVTPSEWLLHYLYISALVSPQHHQSDSDDHEYLLSFLRQRKVDLSIYGKAACAVVMAREGDNERAQEYLKSLKEYAVTSEEMGMYFDTPRAQRSWFNYEIPTVAMAIEATQLLTPEDTTSIQMMRQWLLMQKRTQMWESNVATVEAIYALFNDSPLTISSSTPSDLSLTVDGQPVDLGQGTAGVGYVKVVVDKGDLRECRIGKSTGQTAWGALYGQSLQAVEKVADDAQGITVERELVLPDRSLRVGDKIKVRITVKADRNYDFVQVCDRRPACLEPVDALSFFCWGYYNAKKDNVTTYYFDQLSKGTTVLEEEYYVDREGEYTSGTCVAQCAYAPEFKGIDGAYRLKVSR